MIKYYCNLTGRLCMKEECKQWVEASQECKFYKNIGRILYNPLNGWDFGKIFTLLEEWRPELRGENND